MAGNVVSVKITADDQASAKLKQVGDNAEDSAKKAGGLGSALGGVAKVAGGFVVGQGLISMGGFLKGAAEAAAEDEAATLRLNQAIKNLAQTNGLGEDAIRSVTAAVNDRIAAGQKLAFSDDDVRDSFQALLAATGDSEEALNRQAVAMDFARGAGIPLEQATRMLGKITEENVEVFKRMGITIGENATEADALAAVQAKFGGQAEAYAKSTAGQMEQAKIRMGELKETIGSAVLPAFTAMAGVLVDQVFPALEKFAGWWSETVQPKVSAFFDWLGPILKQLGDWIGEEFKKVSAWYESDLKPAFDNVIGAVQAVVGVFREHWPQISAIVGPIVEAVVGYITMVLDTFKNVVQLITDLIQGDWRGAWENLKDIVSGIKDGLIGIFGNIVEAVWNLAQQVLPAAADVGAKLISGIIDVINAAPSTIASAVWSAVTNAIPLMGEVGDWLVDVAWDIIRGFAKGLKDAALNLLPEAGEFVGGVVQRVKGPLEKDLHLLDENAAAIIKGFGNALKENASNGLGPIGEYVAELIQKLLAEAEAKAAASAGGGGSGGGPTTPTQNQALGGSWAEHEIAAAAIRARDPNAYVPPNPYPIPSDPSGSIAAAGGDGSGYVTEAELNRGIPRYARGTSYVPRTGLALLHQGEAVIPASQNRGGLQVTIQALDARSFEDWLRRGGGDVLLRWASQQRAMV